MGVNLKRKAPNEREREVPTRTEHVRKDKKRKDRAVKTKTKKGLVQLSKFYLLKDLLFIIVYLEHRILCTLIKEREHDGHRERETKCSAKAEVRCLEFHLGFSHRKMITIT